MLSAYTNLAQLSVQGRRNLLKGIYESIPLTEFINFSELSSV